ncbi:MAG TPA: hypothetical protein VNM67_06820 [Thermoanaerobaculia bacterium]|jgi:hypothetical protein|nr:hypothetical protein [Thermoanaerobaculia bacterium]
MEAIKALWDVIGSILMALYVGYCFWAWAKRGGWVPRYFHVLAFTLYGLGWLALRSLGDARGVTLLVASLVFPAIAYILFIAFGGVEAAAEAREKKSI